MYFTDTPELRKFEREMRQKRRITEISHRYMKIELLLISTPMTFSINSEKNMII